MTLARLICAAFLCLPLLVSAQQLTVSAAASLTDAFKAVSTRFEATHPGVTVRLNFAASGLLLQQIAQGAPVDVFASADAATLDRAAAQRLMAADTRRDFAGNQLVLITPAPPQPMLTTLADLSGPGVKRIAIGKPASVPAGRYAAQALERAKLTAALAPKLVYADNVRQVLDYVARGEAEAGFVYRSDAAQAAGKVQVVMTVPGHDPITYPAAIVSDSRQPVLARAFIAFLTGPEAQALLARHGFSPP